MLSKNKPSPLPQWRKTPGIGTSWALLRRAAPTVGCPYLPNVPLCLNTVTTKEAPMYL